MSDAEPAAVTVPPAIDRRNLWAFGIGTVGRDMVYTLVSLYLVFFLSDVLRPPPQEFLWASSLILIARLFDAVADIVMGAIVDNTRTRWGHYKPWIAVGVVASSIATVLLFTDLGLTGTAFVVVFALVYLLWSLSWTANDIPYWSLLPALTIDQKQRERFGSVAKIFATIGLFVVVVAVLPVTQALTPSAGATGAWTLFAIGVVAIMLCSQSVTLFGVREPPIVVEQERTSLRGLARVVFGNDQLLWTAIAMVLFMTGYLTTTTFGTYYFKYVYGDETMYSPFGAVLVASQLVGYAIFPWVSKRYSRRTLYSFATGLILAGYLVFFVSPAQIAFILVAGLLLFLGSSFITLLMLVFLTDTIEYGQWKLGRRNGAVTFALQPFINKVGAALSTEIVAVAIVIAGVNPARPADTSASGLLTIKIGMLVLPPVLIVISYLIYRAKYRIDEAFYDRIVADLRERGELRAP
ncbi:MAG: glycoside-pentoside-hexuronide (GPH):cation symporter [Actinobacteria bacterium]|nr:glycoside-pentoside-hexuronide (GPH):cation symporter [Actinomycetota bacterium]